MKLEKEEKEFLKLFIKFANYIPDTIELQNEYIIFFIDGKQRGKFECFSYEHFKNIEPFRKYTLSELGLEE